MVKIRSIIQIVFTFISFTFFCQNINDLEKVKSDLYSKQSIVEINKNKVIQEYDSILLCVKTEKNKLNLFLSQITKSKDSLNKLIDPFKISEDNIKIFNLLKNEKIIDPSSKKFEKFYKILRKEYFFLNMRNFLLFEEFLYLLHFDEIGRISSVEKIKFSEKLSEKQKKLINKNVISVIAENNSLLEKLTGVNSEYILLKKQLDEIDEKFDFVNSEIKRNQLNQDELNKEFTQKKSNLEIEFNLIAKTIKEVDDQIAFTSLQKEIAIQKTINYSKYKTKKVNGIDICTSPLSVREFSNGDEIKKARTEGEWNKFNELNIPAYHFNDFDENQANYGFIYNYHAITDNRELAPFGFHKLNLIDFNHLENQLLFTDTKLIDCYCGDGAEGVYVSCTNCNYWTETQREYNVCSKCQNRRYFNKGTKKCSKCNGTKKIKALNMIKRNFCVFPSSINKLKFENSLDFIWVRDANLLGVLEIGNDGKCNLKSHSTETIKSYGTPDIDYKEQGFQILICKDRNVDYSDDFEFTKIGDIEIMNTYLNVTKFRNGDPIKYIEDPVEWELALKNKIPAYCYFNNINDGNGCIYNKHAWDDKRGLMPLNWRSITTNDLYNLALTLDYEFTLNSYQSAIKPPKGVRNKNGIFETIDTKKHYSSINKDYFRHLNFSIKQEDHVSWVKYELRTNSNWEKVESGYVFCVRDAKQIRTNQSKDLKNAINKDSSFKDEKLSEEELFVGETVLEQTELDTISILYFAEESPEFPGGYVNMLKYLAENIKYPQVAIENEISGKCYLKFVVLLDGSISQVSIQRGVPDCPECDKEAKRVVTSMPKWKPAKIGGKAVVSSYTLPIIFTLQ